MITESKREYMKKWRHENRDKIKASKKREYEKHKSTISRRNARNFQKRYSESRYRDRRLRYSKAHWDAQKLKAISYYGGKCAECGEDDLDLLCLDHVNNDGNKHRSKHGNKIYRLFHKHGPFEDTELQVLCHNHNFKKEVLTRRSNAKAPPRNRKLEALEVYGKVCAKCGEADTDILQLDHIDGGGVAHFREVKLSMAVWAKKNGYPKIFQTLCPNCNFKKHLLSIS
jgi:hypothetical protein